MLTFVESLSLAGDRQKQNDDACGFDRGAAWVIGTAVSLAGCQPPSPLDDTTIEDLPKTVTLKVTDDTFNAVGVLTKSIAIKVP